MKKSELRKIIREEISKKDQFFDNLWRSVKKVPGVAASIQQTGAGDKIIVKMKDGSYYTLILTSGQG